MELRECELLMQTASISLPIALKLGTSGERHCGFLPPRGPAAFAGQLSAGKTLKVPLCVWCGVQIRLCVGACKGTKHNWKKKKHRRINLRNGKQLQIQSQNCSSAKQNRSI